MALVASNYDLGPRENYRSWLLDTGCKYDLTTRASIPTHQIDLISRAPVPILLATANDLVSGDKIAPQQIMELGEVAEPYVLDSTLDVLSIGQRCVEGGYTFEWKPFFTQPYNYDPKRADCDVRVKGLLSIPRRLQIELLSCGSCSCPIRS